MERKFRITVEGHPYIVTVEDLTEGGSLIYPEPGSMHIPAPAAVPAATLVVAPPVAAAPGSAAGAPGDEVSPLAGVVHAIEVGVGQNVNAGDKIASIEAMKMVTAVFAHHSGKVTHIAVKPGDSVAAGQVLLSIGEGT